MHHVTTLVPRARALAIAMHDAARHQRSGGEPYWRHPERVAATLNELGLGEEVIAAAWLHDVPEDCPTDEAGCEALLRMIARDFGPVVGGLVREVTNYFGPGATMEEKQAKLFEHARHMTDGAKWIKLADRLDNISGMIGWSDEKKARYAAATVTLIRSLQPLPQGSDDVAKRILQRASGQVA